MVISQDNPSPGIKSASLEFPLTNRYETGSYAFIIEAKALFEPRMITTSCYKEPLFAIRVDLNTSTGEMLVSIGLADNRPPQFFSFLLPRYIKDLPEHKIEINFQNWQIVLVEIDGISLQIAPTPAEIILIHHDIESIVSVWDLLRPNGTMPLKLSGDFDSWNGLSLFWLFAENYEFRLFVDENELVLRRSGYEVRTPIKSSAKSMVWVIWSPTQINLSLSENPLEVYSTITTISIPPKSLFQLARIKKLQPTNSFASIDNFRTAIHEALCSLQYDIAEAGAYNGFWDQNYQGKRKNKPTPKKETDIHRQILLPLYDWAKMRSVEIIPENETSVGKLDICFIGNVEGQGLVPFCVEVKLAHSRDLEHGLEVQLPEYISSKRAIYGTYLVIWFKGTWFDLPKTETIHRIREHMIPNIPGSQQSELSELEFTLITKTVITPHLRNIRVFVLDVSKPVTASKKGK